MTGDPIPVSGSQSASGTSCGEGYHGVLLVPWVRGGNAIFMNRAAVERVQRRVEPPTSIELNLLTVFRCRDGAPLFPAVLPGMDPPGGNRFGLRGLSLRHEDDCRDVSAVLLPVDWASIATCWRDRQ